VRPLPCFEPFHNFVAVVRPVTARAIVLFRQKTAALDETIPDQLVRFLSRQMPEMIVRQSFTAKMRRLPEQFQSGLTRIASEPSGERMKSCRQMNVRPLHETRLWSVH